MTSALMRGVLDIVDRIHSYRSLVPLVRIAVLLLVGLLLELGARVFIPRLTARVAARASQVIDLEKRQRSATVAKFSMSVARLVLWTLIFVSVLSEININVGPLLAGAGVMGAALAFGAQNIIKDYLAGFFILLENQYTLGDFVRIRDLSGTVEEITMRITVLRGVDGTMHVVPNGTIQSVSNMTSAWARVIVDVNVAYRTDVDRALSALGRVAAAFHADPAWARYQLEAPEVQGVVAMSETAVTMRISVRVIAEEQWRMHRELLYRTKRELDAAGISPPFAAMPPPAPPEGQAAQAAPGAAVGSELGPDGGES
jgi:small-conductance mechanosensitive channel